MNVVVWFEPSAFITYLIVLGKNDCVWICEGKCKKPKTIQFKSDNKLLQKSLSQLCTEGKKSRITLCRQNAYDGGDESVYSGSLKAFFLFFFLKSINVFAQTCQLRFHTSVRHSQSKCRWQKMAPTFERTSFSWRDTPVNTYPPYLGGRITVQLGPIT